MQIIMRVKQAVKFNKEMSRNFTVSAHGMRKLYSELNGEV
jgi:hypothetical protein